MALTKEQFLDEFEGMLEQLAEKARSGCEMIRTFREDGGNFVEMKEALQILVENTANDASEIDMQMYVTDVEY